MEDIKIGDLIKVSHIGKPLPVCEIFPANVVPSKDKVARLLFTTIDRVIDRSFPFDRYILDHGRFGFVTVDPESFKNGSAELVVQPKPTVPPLNRFQILKLS